MIITIVLVKKLLFCCLKMEGVGVYVATIHDKNANSFKLSYDHFPSYLILFQATYFSLILHLRSITKGYFLHFV